MTRAPGRSASKRGIAAVSLLLAIAACGGATSPSEYVEGLNNFVADVGPDLDASRVAYEQIVEPTMDDWATFVDREIELHNEINAKFETLDPPNSVDEVHQILADALERGLASTEALAAVAATAGSVAEAEATAAYAEYVAAHAEGSSSVCRQAQDRLDDLASSGEQFADAPWVSSLTLTVRATLGCLE